MLQVIWEPYTDGLLATVPPVCRDGEHLWRARVPLICFAYVEWHFPDRVLRQFGMFQHIPDHPDTEDNLHRIDRRGRREIWSIFHIHHCNIWDFQRAHADYLVVPRVHDPLSIDHYMTWYRSVTRMIIAPPIDPTPQVPRMEYETSTAAHHRAVDGLIYVAKYCASVIRDTMHDAARTMSDHLLGHCRNVLEDVGEMDRLERELQQQHQLGIATTSSVEGRRRRRGRGRGRSGIHPPPPVASTLTQAGPSHTRDTDSPTDPAVQKRRRQARE